MAATAEGTGLGVVLDVPGPAAVGLPIIASLAVVNRGREPRVVSSRLNLIEGDVRLRVTKPDGTIATISGAGGQPDTAYRQATLPPGHEIRGGMNLQADASTFAEPGTYVLQADYLPSPREEWVESRPVRLQVAGGTAAQRDAAALLARDHAGTALALGQEGAADALRVVVERHGDTPAGRLARLMLAGSQAAGDVGPELDRLLAAADPETVAVWLRALSTPFSGTGERLAEALASRLEQGDAAKSASRERAVRIARGLPFRSI